MGYHFPMAIDWTAFTPAGAATGGALIGLAAAGMWLGLGRIAGVSGIAGGLLRAAPGDRLWRTAFVAGLLASPWLYAAATRLPAARFDTGAVAIVAAGVLVGLGTRFGNGCTSGHGVCGMARLSPRSLVATLSFMAAGFATVFVIRHLVG